MGILSEISSKPELRANDEVIEFSTTIFNINYDNELHFIVRRIKNLHSMNEESIRTIIDSAFLRHKPYSVDIYPFAGHLRIALFKKIEGYKSQIFEIRMRPKTY